MYTMYTLHPLYNLYTIYAICGDIIENRKLTLHIQGVFYCALSEKILEFKSHYLGILDNSLFWPMMRGGGGENFEKHSQTRAQRASGCVFFKIFSPVPPHRSSNILHSSPFLLHHLPPSSTTSHILATVPLLSHPNPPGHTGIDEKCL